MKKLLSLLFFCATLCGLLMLAACGGTMLDTPSDLHLDEATLQLSWRAVPNARYYGVQITDREGNAEEHSTRGNSYSLESLEEGVYKIIVKAVADGVTNSDSAWSSEFQFTREYENGLLFRLINNGTEYEVSGIGSASGDIVIPDMFRGKPVTAIGERAFSNRALLTSVKMSDSITKIGRQAFSGCSYLTNVEFSQSLTEIGELAFQACRQIEKIVLPDGVTELKEGTFRYCRKLSDITFGKGLVTIGEGVFTDCDEIREVVIPDTVTYIGEAAFSKCDVLQSVTIGKKVVDIGDSAFSENPQLISVTFTGEQLISIGGKAFENCKLLESIVLPNSVQSIGSQAFRNAEKLIHIAIGSNVTFIGQYAFLGTAYAEQSQDNLVYLNNWLVDVKDKSIPLDPYCIKDGTIGIAMATFYRCGGLMQIVVPDSVKEIGQYAFANCPNLTSVVVGSGVERIGRQAFSLCPLLETVVLGSYDFETQQLLESSVTEIDSYAFYKSEQLKTVLMPNSITQIGKLAFRETALYKNSFGAVYAGNWLVDFNIDTAVSALVMVRDDIIGIADYSFYSIGVQSVVLPDGMTTIGRGAFYGCSNLQTITLPSTLVEISDYTFYGCSALESITFPETLKRIGRSAFYGCLSLCGVEVNGDDLPETVAKANDLADLLGETQNNEGVLVIPDSVEEIGDYAFFSCGEIYVDDLAPIPGNAFRKVLIGNGLKKIGYCVFANCTTLETVVIGSSVEIIDSRAFSGCKLLTEVVMGESVKSIGDRAFRGCTSLKTIILPESLQEIADYTFYNCRSLDNVVLGNQVTKIGDYAFYNCKNLVSLTIPESVLTIGTGAFRGCSGLKSVLLGKNVESVGMHAFYACNSLTIYSESNGASEDWSAYWNSSYRPVIFDVTIESGYVASVIVNDGSIVNNYFGIIISDPTRAGYVFSGWSTMNGGTVEYESISHVPNGTTVYSVWTPVEA